MRCGRQDRCRALVLAAAATAPAAVVATAVAAPLPAPADDAPAPADAASFILMREQLQDVLDTLTPREKKVLTLRFGLDDGRLRTLEEVGREFDGTRERIRQIEAKALRKRRHPSRSRKLKDYIE